MLGLLILVTCHSGYYQTLRPRGAGQGAAPRQAPCVRILFVSFFSRIHFFRVWGCLLGLAGLRLAGWRW